VLRIRTLLVAATVGSLALTGALTGPAHAHQPTPAAASGHLVTWGTGSAAAATTLPPELAGKRIVSVSASDAPVSGAVTDDGELVVWGSSGDGVQPGAPTHLTDVAAVSLKQSNGMVLNNDGTVVAWGSAAGISAVPTGLEAKAIAMGGLGTAYAVTTDGTLAYWGAAPAFGAPPASLTGLRDVVSANLSAALDSTGNVTTWPDDTAMPGLSAPDEIQGHVTSIATGGYLFGAILDDGSMRIWGMAPVPTVPAKPDGKNVVSLAIGNNNNIVAVTDDGQVHAWGPTAALTDLSAVDGINDGQHAVAVSIGQNHAAVIVTDFRAVTPPAIDGTPVVGQTLTATPAGLSLEPDSPATGQWLADGDPIAGANGTTLELDEGLIDSMISYRTTATRGGVDVESTSTEVGPVTPATVASTTTLSVTPASGGYGAVRTATATVAAPDGTPTGSVTFTLDGKTATATLAAGKATWKLPNDLSVGAHSLSASYAGDSNTDPSASTATTVTVSKAGSTLKAGKAKVKGKTKAMAKKAILNLDVDTDTGTSAAGTVTLKLKAKGSKSHKVTVTVGADGLAKIKLKKLKRGTYKATWTYAGSPTVDGSKLKAKVKI
jgi:hypothetical protein